MNRSITEAKAEKVPALQRANLEAAMHEGYIAERSHRNDDLVAWDAIEVEGWPEWTGRAAPTSTVGHLADEQR
jgi:hypothetical protein